MSQQLEPIADGFDEPIERSTPEPSSDGGTSIDDFGPLEPVTRIESGPILEAIDPGSFNPETRTKRRGRPPGSRNRSTEPGAATAETTAQGISLDGFEELLLSLHFMGAAMLSAPELEITEAESRKLSKALKKVGEHYPLVLSPKRAALLNLVSVAGGIYGPKAIGIWKRYRTSPPKPKVLTMPKRDDSKPVPVQNVEMDAQNLPKVPPSALWPEPPQEE